jgi:hypothetical protein
MYAKTSDRQHFHRREASHATKGAANGMVPWARDEFDPYAERAGLNKRRQLLKKQLAILQDAGPLPRGVLRKYRLDMERLKAEIRNLPRRPQKLPTVPELLTDACPADMNVHKFRRLQRRWAAT